MYVCLCNGITDCQFRAHAQDEACTVSMVYRALGKKPQCGKCVPFVKQLVRQSTEVLQPHRVATAPH
jgi:bacterioferritin-associated ferredoxin